MANNSPISTNRLDKFIANNIKISRRDVRLMLAQGRVMVDGNKAQNIDQLINRFSHITLDDKVLQSNAAIYIMLHKPTGVVSATKDSQHQTVIDLIEHPAKDELHIVGRLDLNTSGLVLLTNDSRWSEALTSPVHKVEKHYQVTLENKLTPKYIDAFAKGMYFEYEGITTAPAHLLIESEKTAHVVLTEGKYHQIKRMFGRFQNPVVGLHRSQVGDIVLDSQLAPRQWRELKQDEVNSVQLS
ncbi:16S rRNA pseudouridine(516) synthase [Thalassotalea sp. M1531]|uniref:Pseudouridine synthase n=1 Tax=Thalassotalea algicola TaxID=2716224 RepID=A0A7Y0LBN6_9GAMM|nr:16S rRNA pseudouridine(516) synthase [Thalassotalea algicola]NMP31167.1 16S rRNA pseudouridine(516) synthase [Thalassotalea algicola]